MHGLGFSHAAGHDNLIYPERSTSYVEGVLERQVRLSTDWECVDTGPLVSLHVGLECTRT